MVVAAYCIVHSSELAQEPWNSRLQLNIYHMYLYLAITQLKPVEQVLVQATIRR